MNMVFFFVIFSALASYSTGQPFNPITELLCDGNISKIPEEMFGGKLECCGKTIYNSKTSRCSDGTVVQIPDHLRSKASWNPCGDHWLVNLAFERSKQCCKNTVYSVHDHICNPETGELLDKHANKYIGFCKGEEYNTRYQQCSEDLINPQLRKICEKSLNPSATSCCGTKPYNQLEEQCCIDTIHPMFNSTRDELLNQCCGRNVYPMPDYVMNKQTYVGRFTCCGEVIVEKSSLTEECCGSIRYNTADSLCCGGVLVENVSFGDRCCGESSYNTELSWCCNGNVYPITFSPQVCHYNTNEPKDMENRETESTNTVLWMYDRYQYEVKTSFFRRLVKPHS